MDDTRKAARATGAAGPRGHGIVVVEAGVVVFANDMAGQLIGAGPQAWVGQQAGDMVAGLDPHEVGGAARERQAMAWRSARVRHVDGGTRALEVATIDVGGDDGASTLYLLCEPGHRPSRSEPGGLGPEAFAALSRRLLEVQEAERRTVARELYDEIGQSLSAVRLQFAQLRRKTADPALVAPLQVAEGMADHALGRVRRLALLLHPPQLETVGLEATLRWYLQTQSGASGVPISFQIDPSFAEAPARLAITTFRIVEEAVSNATRHAGARHIDVRVHREDGSLVVDVVDDGHGFPERTPEEGPAVVQAPGLLAMQERARALGGDCKVHSARGIGTTIAARLPWR